MHMDTEINANKGKRNVLFVMKFDWFDFIYLFVQLFGSIYLQFACFLE